MWRVCGRWCVFIAVAFIALEVFFILRIATMAVVDPQSTAFERSEAWRLTTGAAGLVWHQTWVPYEQVSDHLKRAVIASEDSDFAYHDGVEWDAIEKAWKKNSKAQEQASKRGRNGKIKTPKIIGGSTITQQLAKNLFLSGERTLLRKGQEFIITMTLEMLLSKQRILEIYLNSVEWGEGVFGAEAAAQHYFRKSAEKLNTYEAAQLAVMLPRPKYFEKNPNSVYLSKRAVTIEVRMVDAPLP
jgi:monofunctional glycosyltransferase